MLERYLQFNPMIKPLLYFFVSVILFSCKSKSQPKLTKVQGLDLYRATTPMYFNFLRLQEKNKDSATILSHILIDNFLKIYLSDTTNRSVVDDLLACYKFNKDYENQIFWAKHQLLHNMSIGGNGGLTPILQLKNKARQRSGVDQILEQKPVTSNSYLLKASPAGQTIKASLPLRQCFNVGCYYYINSISYYC